MVVGAVETNVAVVAVDVAVLPIAPPVRGKDLVLVVYLLNSGKGAQIQGGGHQPSLEIGGQRVGGRGSVIGWSVEGKTMMRTANWLSKIQMAVGCPALTLEQLCAVDVPLLPNCAGSGSAYTHLSSLAVIISTYDAPLQLYVYLLRRHSREDTTSLRSRRMSCCYCYCHCRVQASGVM